MKKVKIKSTVANKLPLVLLFLISLSPSYVVAQRDFEKRFFTIDATSLPEVESLSRVSLKKENAFTSQFTLPDFKQKNNTYWQAVDMVSATKNQKNFSAYKYPVPTLNGYELIPDEYISDGKTRVKNTVQKNIFGLDILDTCPPGGICPRCAPYRLNNGF